MFILSVVLPYLITCGVAIISTIVEINSGDNTASNMFHQVALSNTLLIIARTIESTVPTTITFCGVILVFQTLPHKNETKATLTFICLSLLSSIYISFSCIVNQQLILWLLTIAIPLEIIPIRFSCNSYAEPLSLMGKHKKEISDCSVSGIY